MWNMQNKIQIEVLVESSKNCSHSRIVASPYYGMKILVAAASDRANTVYMISLDLNLVQYRKAVCRILSFWFIMKT